MTNPPTLVNVFDCDDIGVNAVVVSVPDGNGNVGTCTTNVTVIDTLPPVAMCQDITVLLDAAGNGSIDPNDADAGSMDNCGIDTLEMDITDVDCSDLGTFAEPLFVYDEDGNEDSCLVNITVLDTIAPTAVCNDLTLEILSGDSVTINADTLAGASSDNCGISSTMASQTTFDISDLGVNPVIVTVTDASGNSTACESNVTVDELVAVIDPVDIDASLIFDAYPNPAQGMMQVDITCVDCIFRDEVQLKLVDMSGKVLEGHLLDKNRTGHHLEIDMSQYAVGTYLLRLETERGEAIQHIVKY